MIYIPMEYDVGKCFGFFQYNEFIGKTGHRVAVVFIFDMNK